MNALETAARRLLAAVDYTGAPHYNVRVRDLVTAAQALAELERALAAVDGPGVDPPAFVRLRVLKRGALYPNPADLHAAIAQLEAQHGGGNWRALCAELVNAPDAVAFWAAVGHIRQAVNAQAATEAS